MMPMVGGTLQSSGAVMPAIAVMSNLIRTIWSEWTSSRWVCRKLAASWHFGPASACDTLVYESKILRFEMVNGRFSDYSWSALCRKRMVTKFCYRVI
jgi:hypothetical protein